MNVSLRRIACSWAVLLGSAALLLAQQAQPSAQPRPGQPRAVQPGRTVQPAQPGQFGRPGGLQAQQLEPSIITLLIIDNNKEIALGQLGQQTSENEQVKNFCEMIVKDHSDFVQKLQQRTGSGARPQRLGAATGAGQGFGATAQPTPPSAAAQPGAGAARRDATTQPPREATAQQDRTERDLGQDTRTAADQQRGQTGQRITVAKPIIGNQPGSELLQLHHELAEKCLDSARRDAEKHGAGEFDKHFLGGQIVAHKEMLDKLQVFERHVSPQTRQLLADAQQSTRKHLEEATSLHEQLSKEGGREGASASGRRTETRPDRE